MACELVAVGSLFIKLFGGQKCGSASCGGCWKPVH